MDIGPSHIPNGQTYGSARVDVIGRVSSVAIDPERPKHLLCGAANGGIWESPDAGATWAPRTDQMPSLAIGALTFDPDEPDACLRRKWRRKLLRQSRRRRLQIH